MDKEYSKLYTYKSEIVNGVKFLFTSDGKTLLEAKLLPEFDGNLVIPEGVETIQHDVFIDYSKPDEACVHIKTVKFPNSLKVIGDCAFNFCEELESVVIPSNVEKIGHSVFANCYNLKEADLQCKINGLPMSMFSDCPNLKKVHLPEEINFINSDCFGGCLSLESIDLPRGLKNIEHYAFNHCEKLKKVVLPSSLKELGYNAFSNCCELEEVIFKGSLHNLEPATFSDCVKLKTVEFPQNIKAIRRNCFGNCENLQDISLPPLLETIEDYAFTSCKQLKEVYIPNTVTSIGVETFSYCKNLEVAQLPRDLKKIGSSAFLHCKKLKTIELPNEVECVDSKAFCECESLENLIFGEKAQFLSSKILENTNIKELTLGKGVKGCALNSLQNANNLKTINIVGKTTFKTLFLSPELPQEKEDIVEILHNQKQTEFSIVERPFSTVKLNKVTLNICDDNLKLKQSIKNIVEIAYGDDGVIVLKTQNNDEQKIYFYENGKLSSGENMSCLLQNATKFNKLDELSTAYYTKLKQWNKQGRKIVPNEKFVELFPVKSVSNFYKDNNAKNWSEISKCAKCTSIEDYTALVKLAYVCGVFSESGKESKRATEFITKEILPQMTSKQLKTHFSRFDITHDYEPEWADFFMQNCNGNLEFLSQKLKSKGRDFELETDQSIDFLCKSFNKFQQVKSTYPNLLVRTRQNRDLLTPQKMIDALSVMEYDNVDDQAKSLAKTLCSYGYSQHDFEKLQEVYLQGLEVEPKQMLEVRDDAKDTKIYYELLKKSNPLNAVLGNITNCCQVMGSVGESCVRYGMTNLNSAFVVFKTGENVADIIGQAWVWYNERKQIVCLDNIEIPSRKMLEMTEKDKQEFCDCLNRFCKNIVATMEKKGKKVKMVTTGILYNSILDFNGLKCPPAQVLAQPEHYDGYSDAKHAQIVLLDNAKQQEKNDIAQNEQELTR